MKKRNTTFWGLMLLGCLLGTQAFAQTNVNHPTAGNAGTFSIAPPGTCFFNYFDNGGSAGNYATSISNSTVTFAPSVATRKINCAFSSYNTEAGFDFLAVFDGPTTGSPLIAQTSGGTPPINIAPNIVRATAANATGQLTFRFFSDFIIVGSGWASVVTEFDPAAAPCAITAPANVTVSTNVADCNGTATVSAPTFSPAGCVSSYQLQYRVNNGAPVIVPQPVAPTVTIPNLAKGVNTITWQVVIACGGTVVSQANQVITVADLTPPAITCPANVTLNLGPGACSQVYSYNVSATDNCPYFSASVGYHAIPDTNIAINLNSVACFGLPVNAFQVLAPIAQPRLTSHVMVGIVNTWPAGSSATATLTVRLYSLNNPNLPYNVTAANRTLLGTSAAYQVPAGSAGKKVYVPISVSIPANATVLMEVNSSSSFVIAMPPAAGTFTWFASDPCGFPSANPSLMVNLIGGGNPSYDMLAALYAAIPGPIPVTQTAGLPSGAEFPIGTTTNCFVATDAAGNTSTCCFTVKVNEYPNPIQSLVCNDLVQVSLDQNCQAVVGADQILEGGPYGCYDDYIVELDKTAPFGNGPWVPAVLGPGDVGKTYQVRVTDPENNNNKCWGNLKVEDKLPPVLVCEDKVVACNSNPDPATPSVPASVSASKNFSVADAPQISTASLNIQPGILIQDVNVVFRTNHTWVGDINGKLTAPNGKSITVFNRPQGGNCLGDGLDVVFDDEATLTAAQFEATCNNNPAIAGTYKPANPLSTFDGDVTGGAWTFAVQDFVGGDAGPNSYVEIQIQGVTQSPGFPNKLTLNVNVFPNGSQTYTVTQGSGTPVMEPCSDATLSYLDTEVSQNCASGLTKKINRKWTAKDASGNTATCIQVISFVRPSLSDVVFPPSYDDINEPAFNCTLGGTYPTPAVIEGAGLQGWPHVFSEPDGCNINWTYTDNVIYVCDGTYKILRKWAVIDWCTGEDVEHNQIIKVLDDNGPAFDCPANITVGTDPFTCCATTDLPDVIIEDACSRIASISAMIQVIDPQTNQTIAMHQVGGSLQNFPGNNLWDLDTLGNFGTTPCLPLGTHLVTYMAEDDCGNTSTCTFRIIVRDYTPPVAACDEFTVVGIGVDDPFDCYLPTDACTFAGVTWVKATTFDDGSYDNCGDLKFTVQRMQPYSDCINNLNQLRGTPACDSPFPSFPSEFERAISEYDSIKFYCCEVGTTQTVILRVYQLDVNGNIVIGPSGEPVQNQCMVQVEVQDKIKPVCQAPAHVTVTCENFDPSLWAYGKPAVYDNCCLDTASVYQGQCGLTHTVNLGLFDTVCNKGTITRTFRAIDCHGQSSTCTQRIVVNYNQNYFVKFPNDVIVTVCDGTGNYGEPTFFGEDCELLGVSHEDVVYTVVPDACFKIERTWTVINWCTYNPNLGCVEVPNPNPNATVNHPSNLPGPTVSACGTPAPWNPTVVAINPGQTPTNYCTFWDKNANCYKYKQIIKVVDTQDPVVQCPASPVEICDLTPNDPLFWNKMYWYDATINSHDLCEAPTDLCITATDLCSGANLNFRYLLFLDLDGDGSMESVVNSINTGIAGLGWNAVPYNNAGNPNYAGGEIRQFDDRPVLSNQKYGFALQVTTSGTSKTACLRWNTQQSQNTYVIPELPYGTHKIKWFIEDGCGNETICEYTFVVKDCKKPTVVCINGLSVNIMPTKMIALWASDFLQYTEDNCTPANQLVIGIRKSGTGTGFPLNPDGTPQTGVTFTCDELGTQLVELWSIDKAGNADFCETYVIVQDNAGICSGAAGTVAGALKTEASNGLEEAGMTLNGTSNALPPGSTFTLTDKNGLYSLNGIPFGDDYTLTPGKDNDPLNGVSTFDLVLINKHILGLEPLSTPYKMIAADANNSRSITTFDIVELRKLILGIYTELPNNTSWRFVDKAYNFPNQTNPFQEIFPETKQIASMLGDKMNQDFTSVKVGDVNGNAIANSLTSTEDRTAGTLLFDVEERSVKAGETFTVNFKAAEKVQGYQFTMNYNNLEVLDIVPGANMKVDNFAVFANEHALTTSWDGDAAAEFAVTFRAKSGGNLSQMLGVSSRITKAEAYNADSDRLQVAFRFNGANGSTISGLGFELYQNSPNPFINKTQIGFYLPQAAEATLTIFDESGRMIYTQTGDFTGGYNAVTIDRSVLNTTGVLYYKLETATDSATKKMIQSK